ncbi:MAG: CTP synthase, partial [Clostridia bacterium]|nr:CTP synthase [Clostridia bacterium]
NGFRLVGASMEAGYPEVFELDGHPFYVGVIFHPEYISRPNRPHPLFCALIARAKSLGPLSGES